ncbi:MAG: flagellin lysine-N-methylase [Myxococcota bacterium]|nr:flagellin lysine-N-methylase [Myxococcota bacterium]
MTENHRTYSYMNSFQCLGSDCEDTCCRGWDIAVDKIHYERIESVCSRDPGGRERFHELVQINKKDDAQDHSYAVIQRTDSSECSFLTADKLCHLQASYGEDVLPDTCSLYPRRLWRYQGGFELTGLLSCPEVARKVFLEEDALLEVPLEPSSLGRLLVSRNRNQEDDLSPYKQGFGFVRELLLSRLKNFEEPLSEVLFILVLWAKKTSTFYHQGIERNVTEQLRQTIDLLEQDEVKALIREKLSQNSPDSKLALDTIQGILKLAAKDEKGRLRSLIDNIYEDWRRRFLWDSDSESEVSAGVVWEAYETQRNALDPGLLNRLEQHSRTFLQHYVQTYAFTDEVDLARYLLGMLSQLAMARFLILNHPHLRGVSGARDGGSIPRLDRVSIEVFYLVGRGVQHHEAVLKGIEAFLMRQFDDTLANARLLLSF